MSKTTRGRNGGSSELDELSWAFLCDAIPASTKDTWKLIGLKNDDPNFSPTGRTTRDLWAEHGAAVLDWWTIEHPGSRPFCWWKYQAPRCPADDPTVTAHPHLVPYLVGKLAAPRRRVGGTGDLTYLVIGGVPRWLFGIPQGWVTADDLNWHPYTGLACTAFDPADPPLFEAQAAYLNRHSLLSTAERKRLSEAAFAPEAATTDNPW